VREQHGFQRTECGCAFCQAPCKHIPGSLDVADLGRLCLAGQDVFAWAEEHLRALTDKPCPTLVPARQANGHCHWFINGRCAVHEIAPYSCAFFDVHMSDAEAERRANATIQARRDDAAANGLYYRVWRHLCRKGLTSRSGDREGLVAEVRRLQRRVFEV
jgi:Fe-S-cluster containining protein